jgi:hypothetical protein
MNRFLLSTVAGILTLVLSGPAWAGGHGHSYGHSSGGSHNVVSHGGTSYHTRYGTKFSHGHYFSGRHQHFWTSSRWSGRYGRNVYWYPGNASWYYWDAALNGYYPLSYLAIAPPDAPVAPPDGPPVP